MYDCMYVWGVKNLFYVYLLGLEFKDLIVYLECYLGDDIIDLVGFDIYQFDWI